MCEIPDGNGQYYLAGVLAAVTTTYPLNLTIFGDVIANIGWIMRRMEDINSQSDDLDIVMEDRVKDIVEDEVIDWKSEMIMKQQRKISKLMELIHKLKLRKCKFQPVHGE